MKSKAANQMERDFTFLEYIIKSAESQKKQNDIFLSLFPKSIRNIIDDRIGESNTEISGLVTALMFAGSDLADKDYIEDKKNLKKKKKSFMIKVVREKYHIKHGMPTNTFYDTQQELAKFLFGISVDYVSNLLWICTKQNSTQLTYIPAAHSIFRENPWMLRK